MRYTFDTFVVGPSNQFAHAAALAVGRVARADVQPALHLRLGGPRKDAPAPGHLPREPAALLPRRIAYLSCETFINEFIDAVKRNDLPDFR